MESSKRLLHPPVLHLRGPDESLRHGESWRTVEDHAEIRLSRAIRCDGVSAARRHDGASHGQRSRLRGIRSDQRDEVGMRAGAYPLQSYVLCHADGRLPRRTPRDPHRLQDGRSASESTTDALPIARIRNHRPRTLRRRLRSQRHIGRGHAKEHGLFATAFENFGLVINTEKTVVMHQRPPDAAYFAPQINVNGAQQSAVDNFTHLDSTLSRNTKSMIRISKASQAFGRL
ncbi:hypothetical protein SprV_0902652800 [Sparganum proliferum]